MSAEVFGHQLTRRDLLITAAATTAGLAADVAVSQRAAPYEQLDWANSATPASDVTLLDLGLDGWAPHGSAALWTKAVPLGVDQGQQDRLRTNLKGTDAVAFALGNMLRIGMVAEGFPRVGQDYSLALRDGPGRLRATLGVTYGENQFMSTAGVWVGRATRTFLLRASNPGVRLV
jgi:hypothetical protein